jgi:hypothetical protein
MAGELEPIDLDAPLAWLVDPQVPPPSPVELVRSRLQIGLPMVVDTLIRLAVSAESERTRLDAAKFVLGLAGVVGVADLSGAALDELLRRVGVDAA